MRDMRVHHYEQLEAYTVVDLLSILFDFVAKYEHCEKESVDVLAYHKHNQWMYVHRYFGTTFSLIEV